MKLQRSDFTYQVTARGYMLQFRGQSIGGAGTLPTDKRMHWQHVRSNTNLFREQAEMRIQNLLAGRGEPRFWSLIKEVQAHEPDNPRPGEAVEGKGATAAL